MAKQNEKGYMLYNESELCPKVLAPPPKTSRMSSSLGMGAYVCVYHPRNCPDIYKLYTRTRLLYRNESLLHVFFYILLFSLTV